MSIFFFNDTATTGIYTLSLHDALPISRPASANSRPAIIAIRIGWVAIERAICPAMRSPPAPPRAISRSSVMTAKRSEEHTSELQSRQYLVCRLLLEKKKQDHQSIPQNS